MSSFVVWDHKQSRRDTTLRDFEGVDQTFPLMAGESLVATFPSDARFSMDSSTPKRKNLTDSPANTSMVIVGSLRLVDFLRELGVVDVEYLPVTILDHKHEPVAEPFFIVHPIRPVDCLDLEGAEPVYSSVLPGQINRVSRLRLHEDRVPGDKKIFRCQSFYRAILVRRDLAEAIVRAGMTGMEWVELEDYVA